MGAYMELTLSSSKPDTFRKGVKITIAANFDIACPLHTMEQFLAHDTHRRQYASLFSLRTLE